MKILRVAGVNLASLDEFDIDFRKVTSDRNRIFAIIGDTGAGKSTILDAICLALYGRTPRISRYGTNSGAVELEEGQSVGTDDSINVMTRGKNNCSATVDFEGRGGVYRAVYSVCKKRTNFSYSFEVRRLDVNGIPGELLVDREKAFRLKPLEDFIQPYTGLTWEQFKKVIVLPQGEFAAFLEDDSKAKTSLLEKLTGTEIYRKIDALVTERISGIKTVLDDYHKRMNVISGQLLSDDARKNIGERLKSCTEEITKTSERIQVLNAYAKYVADLSRVNADIAALNAEKQKQEARKDDYRDDYRIKSLFDLSRPLRDIHINLNNVDRNLENLRKNGTELADSQKALEANLHSSEEILKKRISEYEDRKKEKDLKAPVIKQAEALEQKKNTIVTMSEESKRNVSEKSSILKKRKTDLAEAEAAGNDVIKRISELDESYKKNQKYEFLKGKWPDLRVRITEYRNCSNQLREKENAAQNHCQAMNEKKSEWLNRYNEYQKLTGDSCQYSFDDGIIPGTGLYEAAVTDAESFRRQAGSVEQCLTTLKFQTDKYLAAAEKTRYWHVGFTDACRQISVLNADSGLTALRKRSAELNDCIRTCDVAIKLHGYAVNLKPGDPCPCCGATVHPRLEGHIGGLESLHDRLISDKATYETELKSVDADIDSHGKKLIELQEMRKTALSGLKISVSELMSADTEIRRTVKQLKEYTDGISVFAEHADEGKVTCLNDLRSLFRDMGEAGFFLPSFCDEKLSPLTENLMGIVPQLSEDGDGLLKDENNKTSQFPDDRLHSFKECTDRIREFHDLLRRKSGEVSVIFENIGNAVKIIEKIKNIYENFAYVKKAFVSESSQAALLKEKVAGLDYRTDDAGLAQAWTAMINVNDDAKFEEYVQKYNKICDSLNDYDRHRSELDTELAVKNTSVESFKRSVADAESALKAEEDELANRERKLAAVNQELLDLTGGVTSRTMTERLQQAIDKAGNEMHQAEINCSEVKSRLAGCQKQQKENEEGIRSAEKEKSSLREKLGAEAGNIASGERNSGHFSVEEIVSAALMEENLYQEALKRVEMLEADIQKTDKALISRMAVHDDTERRLAEIRTRISPEDYAEDGNGIRENVLAEAESKKRLLEEEKSEHEGSLRNDKSNLAELENLRNEIEKIRNNNKSVYELKELFDIKRSFKEYAQKITFGYLVSKANRYILDFTSGRYELKQVSAKTKKDREHEVNYLEIAVIDHDRGDSSRLVNSLSGGEKFRVALGLALGLSDLIVRNVRVDNMFIDEGFDTLDNERLDSLLNSLSTVTNRQIGIITHVDQVVNGGMIQSRILVRHRAGDSSRSEVVVL